MITAKKNDTRNKIERLPLNLVRELCENRRNLYVLVAIDRRGKSLAGTHACVAAGVVRPKTIRDKEEATFCPETSRSLSKRDIPASEFASESASA